MDPREIRREGRRVEDECGCVYNTDAHPECDPLKSTHLLGAGGSVIPMCEWCATDWNRRHPEMEVVAK